MWSKSDRNNKISMANLPLFHPSPSLIKILSKQQHEEQGFMSKNTHFDQNRHEKLNQNNTKNKMSMANLHFLPELFWSKLDQNTTKNKISMENLTLFHQNLIKIWSKQHEKQGFNCKSASFSSEFDQNLITTTRKRRFQWQIDLFSPEFYQNLIETTTRRSFNSKNTPFDQNRHEKLNQNNIKTRCQWQI